MSLSPTTFDYLKPTAEQMDQMERLRGATRAYADRLEAELPEGPDKTYILRSFRSLAMWINVSLTRQPDGSPR